MFKIHDAKVACGCISSEDVRSHQVVSSLKFCKTCNSRKCFYCTLHQVKKSVCDKCSKEYGMDDSHCTRCYVCPSCDRKLVTSQYLYKCKDGTGDYELIRKREDKDKYVGKSVSFKCSCGYKFTTKVGKKEEMLYEIVNASVKSQREERFEQLAEYNKWVLNYHRILDKKAAMRWKSEILEMFSDLEITKVLKNDYVGELEKREAAVCDWEEKENGNVECPSGRRLTKKFADICVACLDDLSEKPLSGELPLVYCIPVIGCPRGLEKVPVLLSVINNTDRELKIRCEGMEVELGRKEGKGFANIPTCLISQIKGDEEKCRKELDKRDGNVFTKLSYGGGEGVVESGVNWATMVVYKEQEFEIDLHVNNQVVEYYCRL